MLAFTILVLLTTRVAQRDVDREDLVRMAAYPLSACARVHLVRRRVTQWTLLFPFFFLNLCYVEAETDAQLRV